MVPNREDNSNDLLIVGIGASAGGLDALQRFFSALPPDGNIAFVVIVHLDPSRNSSLASLLQSRTSMQVGQVTDREKIEAGHVYVIPPDKNLSIADGHITTSDFQAPRGQRAPIDLFFRSLAKVPGGGAAIILSGSGTDGTVGIKLVNEQGGFVMAQEPADAAYDSMPRSAIGTGLVDFVLPAEGLARKVVEFQHNRNRIQLPTNQEELPEDDADALRKILHLLRSYTGHDFKNYKESTVLRRIGRRMQMNQIDSLRDYLVFLGENPLESQALLKNLLISVTHFFRDQQAWEVLGEKVFPQMLLDKEPDEQLRIWVPGCATGEEAYSICILLMEQAETLDILPDFQIFASDLDQRALAFARNGLYPEAIEVDISEERLRRYFRKEDEHYRIRKDVRERVLFAVHSLLNDPPFSRLDLISCRNLLIYLNRDLQERMFQLFHYALQPGGWLFLGSAESADGTLDLFEVFDRTNRIYRNSKHKTKQNLQTGIISKRIDALNTGLWTPHVSSAESQLDRYQRLLVELAPPSVIVNRDLQLIHLTESAGRYFQRPAGTPSHDILREVRPELRVELQAALQKAFRKGQPTSTGPIKAMLGGNPEWIHLIVQPGDEEHNSQNQAMVIFAEVEMMDVSAVEVQADGATDHDPIVPLKAEVQRLRQHLQSTIEEYESSKEEMRAANEELQSINEEYKSTTEELETSTEELQSVNEELETVNQQLKVKVDELSQANDDLQNLMAATEIGTLFLDRELCIQRFTPRISELFNIRKSDLGRPITHLRQVVEYEELEEDFQRVLRDLTVLERGIEGEDGTYYLTRLRPYRTVDDRIDGIVLTFIEITEQKRAEAELRDSQAKLKAQLSSMRHLHQLVSTLMVSKNIHMAMDEVLTATVELMDADKGSVQVLDPKDGTLQFAAQIGFDEEFLDYFSKVAADDTTACARAMQEKHRIIVYDVLLDPMFEPYLEVVSKAGYRTVHSTPLLNRRGEVLGILSTYYKEPQCPSDRDFHMLDLYARQAADFIARQRVEEQLRELNESLEKRIQVRTRQVRKLASLLTVAEQAERQRTAQILHDDLQQLLYGCQMKLHILSEDAGKEGQTKLQESLEEAEAWVETSIRITRTLAVDLNPPVLEMQGFSDAVRWLGSQMEQLYNLTVQVKAEKPFEMLDDELRILLYQLTRELLFNVAKHAGIRHADVDIWGDNDLLHIRVIDEGDGFDMQSVLKDRQESMTLGLLTMGERLGLFGGNVDIESSPGDGTRVTIHIPLQPR